MKINKFFAGLFMLANLAFVSPVLAGGGGVYVDATKTDDPLANIVRVYINPTLYTCKGINVSLSFLVPEDGDRISGSDSDGSSTINSDAEYVTINGKEYLRCSTYLKVYTAHTALNRILNIYLKGMGGESRQIAFSPGYEAEYNSSLLLPWEDSSNSDPQPITPKPTIIPTPNTIIINPDPTKCYPNPCTIKTLKPTDFPKPTIKPNSSPESIIESPKPEASPTLNPNDKKVEELNNKVNNLQNQLEQSKKTQGLLEQRINDLVNFLKKLFPIFQIRI